MPGWRRLGAGLVFLLAAVGWARAADDEVIKAAIAKGVAYLKSHQLPTGGWGSSRTGMAALAGLTLLECGEPATDPVVVKATEYLRAGSVKLCDTYSLVLSILYFDRLGDPRDIPLIESLAVRLLAGQTPTGAWTYQCPPVGGEDEFRRLQTLQQRNELVSRPALPKAGAAQERPLPSNDVKRLMRHIPAAQLLVPPATTFDHSNTQFAAMGLWAARRYGVPVDPALARLARHFRDQQNADGGWPYQPSPTGSTAAMTCAGLLGLAVYHGAANDRALAKDPDAESKKLHDPGKDRAIRQGLAYLGAFVGDPPKKRVLQPGALPQHLGKLFYALWSLERVAVTYDLKTIGKKDWYAWGAELLLQCQAPDGAWLGSYPDAADTCFALLFLRKANLSRDLTNRLKGKVEDPGEVYLKAGGVGGKPIRPDKGDVIPGEESGSDQTKAPPGEAGRLVQELVKAGAAQREALIDKLKDGKGNEYTQALAWAISKLEGKGREDAREALALRLAGMTTETIRGRFSDDDAEIRRAAALACVVKDDKSFIPDLISLLEDKETVVQRAAHAALKSLSGKDFGPAANADALERATARAAWKAWWKQQNRK